MLFFSKKSACNVSLLLFAVAVFHASLAGAEESGGGDGDGIDSLVRLDEDSPMDEPNMVRCVLVANKTTMHHDLAIFKPFIHITTFTFLHLGLILFSTNRAGGVLLVFEVTVAAIPIHLIS